MPAKAGIQYVAAVEWSTERAEYWITRWSLSSGSPKASSVGG
jgi:hypothetical protein